MGEESLKAIIYENNTLQILDQTLLPHQTKFIVINGVEDGWKAINSMQVRGAPAIAIVGCLSLVIDIFKKSFDNKDVLKQDIQEKLSYLISSRPTAVNMKGAADDLIMLLNKMISDESISTAEMKEKFVVAVEDMLKKDVSDNMAIGQYGATEILKSLQGDGSATILTHCNTGSLATAGYGTALGVVRSLFALQKLEHVYCTETRPYNQGSRLTAYELVHDKIPATLVTDSMVAWLMKQRKVTAVVVGADRVAANGDTANKIGTYQIAALAKLHNIPFYIAAPFTSIDLNLKSGEHITIEERPEREMTYIGNQRVAAQGINCWNPAFDVTPASLIAGIITEKGVYKPMEIEQMSKQKV